MTKRTKFNSLLVCSGLLLSIGALTSCSSTTSTSTSTSASTSVSTSTGTSAEEENVDVKEVILELSAGNVQVGKTVTANVSIRPTNATNKEYTISVSDTTLASVEGNTITALKKGVVTVTARSKSNITKKAEAKLTILGADDEGRFENIFEAEDATLIGVEGSKISAGITDDDRISGSGVVGNTSVGDRIVWGIKSTDADDNASLSFRLMGPSGWLGMWDTITYDFADWYSVKVNGKLINTEDITVEGTLNRGSLPDYYAVKDVTIGNIALNAGENTISFIISNRYNTTYYSDANYGGTIAVLANVDSMTVASSKTLTAFKAAGEPSDAEADVKYTSLKLEAEADTTRIYKDAENPLYDIGDAQAVEFTPNMNVMFGLRTQAMKARFALRVATPFTTSSAAMTEVEASDFFSLNVNGADVSILGMKLSGSDKTGAKDNYTTLTTGWIDLEEKDNVLDLVVKGDVEGYEFLGGLDFAEVQYFRGEATAFLNEEPNPQSTYTFEAEAEETKRVGYDTLASGATYVELKNSYKVQTDVYNGKYETTKIIYGIESDSDCYATLTMRMSSPYIDATTAIADAGLGSLGDLWVNGTMVSTPEIISGTDSVGVKDNFTNVVIGEQVELKKGKNRIAWEPTNYYDNDFAFMGAMDNISVTTTAQLDAYEVNFWTDRNTYFDDTNNEPIYVTCDEVAVAGGSASNCWIGLAKDDDTVEANFAGSLYYYAPSNSGWNSDGQEYLGKPCNIIAQNPNDKRPLISGETGGHYKLFYTEQGSNNAQGGYDVYDYVYISVWNDPSIYA